MGSIRRILAIAIPVGGVLLLVVHALFMRRLFLGNSFDDAYIAYRYADHLAHGLGLVFNPGERVEGYSDFLWVLLLAPVARLGGDLVLASQLLGLTCSAASLVLAVVAMRRLLAAPSRPAEAGLVLLLAGSGYVAAWSVGGLEGPLFGLLLLGAWMALAAPRPILAAVLLAALALLRPEGIVIGLAASAVAAGVAWRRPAWRRAAWIPIVVVGVIALYEVWRFACYGPFLVPNSVRAKVGPSGAQVLRGALYVVRRFLVPYAPLLVPFVLLRTWRPLAGPVRVALGVGGALVLGSLLLVVVVGGDWSEGRLFAPLLPLAATLAAGWCVHVARGVQWRRSQAIASSLAVAGFLVASFVVTGPLREAAIRRRYAATDAERIVVGRWLHEHMPPDVVVAVRAAGEIPYFSRLTAHDMLGLNDAHIAALSMPGFGSGDPGHEKFDVAYTLGTVRPGIIVDGRLIPGLVRHPLYLRNYHPLQGPWTLHDLVIRHDLALRLGLLDRGSGP
jgi:hypothetical protein